ncbi:MAG: hypothetical protein ACSHXK_06720 [Oceanococcus sp.]
MNYFSRTMVFSLLLAVVPMSHAAIERGDIELGVNLSVNSPDASGADDSLYVSANFGINVLSQLQVKVAGLVIESGGTTIGSVGAGADYQLNFGQAAVPFAGLSYQANVGDIDLTDFIDLHIGLKQFVGERMSIQYQLQKLEPVDDEFDIGSTIFSIGLNVYF